MPRFIGFLRAVNVGGRKYPMAELRAAVETAGFAEVATYIQTGNLRVRTSMRSAAKVTAALEQVFLADRGFEVPTIVLTPVELDAVVADVDELTRDHQPAHGHYVTLYKQAPTRDVATQLEAASVPGERLVVRGRVLHLLNDVPFAETTSKYGVVEKRAGLVGTNRNVKVIRALGEMWT